MSAPTGAVLRKSVFLVDAGPNKIMVIKTIREHVGLGLKEAKDMAESGPREIVAWDDAGRIERFRKALIEAGATVR